MKTQIATTIEQSKKLLALGVSPESADMIYTMVNGRCTPFIRIESIDEVEEDDVLCWSLAALLDVLPKIQNSKPVVALDDNYITYPLVSHLHTKADNLVDACYEVIIKLYELKML